MKLIRFGNKGVETPGVVLGCKVYALKELIDGFEDFTPEFFCVGKQQLEQKLLEVDLSCAPHIDIGAIQRFGHPIARPGKIVCIGLNYVDHAHEAKLPLPSEPVVFFKSPSAMAGCRDPLWIPPGCRKVDWEIELAFVVGKRARLVSEESANVHIAGYLLHIDYSERDWQFGHSGQWVKGKCFDTFATFGPHMVTSDEVGDISKLSLQLEVNGERMQDGNTSNMVAGIPKILSYLSSFMTLEPGDIVSTGTPRGVGMGMSPPRFLAAGDVVTSRIDGLGETRQVASIDAYSYL